MSVPCPACCRSILSLLKPWRLPRKVTGLHLCSSAVRSGASGRKHRHRLDVRHPPERLTAWSSGYSGIEMSWITWRSSCLPHLHRSLSHGRYRTASLDFHIPILLLFIVIMQLLPRHEVACPVWHGSMAVNEKISLAHRLKEARLDRGLKQADIGEPLDIKQSTVSVYERTPLEMVPRGAGFVTSFIRQYGFTENHARNLTIELFDLWAELKGIPRNDLPEPMPVGNLVRLPVLSAQGGTVETYTNDRGSGERYADVPQLFLDGHLPANCAVVEAYGDSMACEAVRQHLPEGSQFIIDTQEEAQDGDIIVCDLLHEGEWKRIFKVVGREGHMILMSYNEEHEPIVMREGMELQLIGVYVRALGMDRAAIRRMNKRLLRAVR